MRLVPKYKNLECHRYLPDSTSHCIAELFPDNLDGHSDCGNYGVDHDPVHLYDGLECYQSVVTSVLNAIRGVVTSIWNSISGYISSVMNTIKTRFLPSGIA